MSATVPDTVDLCYAILAKLNKLEEEAKRFRPTLVSTKEAAKELGFGSMKTFYGWCRHRGIKCEKGLVDMDQIYAVWKKDTY